MCWKWCMQSYSIFISLMLILILKYIIFINKKWVYQNLRLRLNKMCQLMVPQKQWPWKFSLKDCISMKSGSEKQIYSWSSYAKALKVFNSIGHLWRTDPKELVQYLLCSWIWIQIIIIGKMTYDPEIQQQRGLVSSICYCIFR